jgi:hypothetical protein
MANIEMLLNEVDRELTGSFKADLGTAADARRS